MQIKSNQLFTRYMTTGDTEIATLSAGNNVAITNDSEGNYTIEIAEPVDNTITGSFVADAGYSSSGLFNPSDMTTGEYAQTDAILIGEPVYIQSIYNDQYAGSDSLILHFAAIRDTSDFEDIFDEDIFTSLELDGKTYTRSSAYHTGTKQLPTSAPYPLGKWFHIRTFIWNSPAWNSSTNPIEYGETYNFSIDLGE